MALNTWWSNASPMIIPFSFLEDQTPATGKVDQQMTAGFYSHLYPTKVIPCWILLVFELSLSSGLKCCWWKNFLHQLSTFYTLKVERLWNTHKSAVKGDFACTWLRGHVSYFNIGFSVYNKKSSQHISQTLGSWICLPSQHKKRQKKKSDKQAIFQNEVSLSHPLGFTLPQNLPPLYFLSLSCCRVPL